MSKTLCTGMALLALGLAGCSKQPQSARPPAPAPNAAAVESTAHIQPARASQVGTTVLRQSTAVLEKLTTTTSESFPDAILSRAKCLVVIPDFGKTAKRPAPGTTVCRNGNSWSDPAFIDFTGKASSILAGGRGMRSSGGDLLVFMMSDRGQHALLKGSINLASDIALAAGPTNIARTIVVDVELKGSDALAYLHSNGKLHGVLVSSGRLRLNGQLTKQTLGRSVTPKTVLQNASRRSEQTELFNVTVNSLFYMIRPAGIIIHHSVLVPDAANAGQELDEFHSKRGFSIHCFGRVYHVAYHYLILPDGTVEAGRPERCQGAHTRGYNSYLGIALVGDFSSQDNPRGSKGQMVPSQPQMRSLLEVTRQLRERYDIPLHRIVRHSDISRTYCPGDRFLFTRFLAALQRSTRGGF